MATFNPQESDLWPEWTVILCNHLLLTVGEKSILRAHRRVSPLAPHGGYRSIRRQV